MMACSFGTTAAQEFTRTELGLNSSTLFHNRVNSKTDSGLGGRFTYNMTSNLALEANANYYLTRSTIFSVQADGRATSAFFGPKAGIRWRRFGIYGKAQPGFVSFSDVLTSASVFGNFATARKTHAALDLGGALEFYPSQRVVVRADVGDVLVRYGDATLFSDPSGISVRTMGTVDSPFHLIIGANYRLGKLRTEDQRTPAAKRVQLGLQYSLQTLERLDFTVRDESAAGAWFTFEISKNFAFDSAVSFFPRKMRFISPQQGGRIVQAVAGIRWGIRRDNYGLFLKFRPGVQIYTSTEPTNTRDELGPHPSFPPFTDLAFDTGGIFEIYTSKHTMLRFDAGETIIYFREHHFLDFDGSPFTAGSFTQPSVQFTAGFGLRF
jgi:hypothetical protein